MEIKYPLNMLEKYKEPLKEYMINFFNNNIMKLSIICNKYGYDEINIKLLSKYIDKCILLYPNKKELLFKRWVYSYARNELKNISYYDLKNNYDKIIQQIVKEYEINIKNKININDFEKWYNNKNK
jgi:hypothetical protein